MQSLSIHALQPFMCPYYCPIFAAANKKCKRAKYVAIGENLIARKETPLTYQRIHGT